MVILRDWKEMDTSRAEELDDEELLKQISLLEIIPGWGLVAELMKRFARDRGLI